MIRCEGCLNAIPADSSSCPSCGTLLSGASLERSVILGRLAEEYTRALRAGGKPDVEEYASRHPELRQRIRELFPTLAALESAAQDRGRGCDCASTDAAADIPDSPSALVQGRFVSGTVLSSRYRIVGLIRKGGMGEVYRAEDLKLGQTVALKFLPENLLADSAALARFHREVSFARNVSHPNVCRVFDINEVDGQHFLSMEYIDGEDLASLIRRIGRLPHAKAVELALQLCRGLAAAHENNVMHCDLKPANVMIDGRGRAKITDFGLACLGGERSHDRAAAGTPAYMAPEQLSENKVSTKSDVYSLGLVLFEMFTGKRAFQAETLSELALLHQRSGPRPSKLVPDIDPTVERLIVRCLRKEPELRPGLQQVLAILSGGDPLAVAMAAGETPSPELIAAARGEGAMRPIVAVAYLVSFLVGLALMVMLSGAGLLHREVPLQKSPTVLADRAASIAESFGYSSQPGDAAYGFERDDGYLEFLAQNDRSPDRWKRLQTGRPAAIYFWYRQSPAALVANSLGRVTPSDPPQQLPGMVTVFLDTRGRLIGFSGVPTSTVVTGNVPHSETLFEYAGLAMADFKQIPAKGSLLFASDTQAAWEGYFPEQPDLPIRVETASYRGLPVFFKIGGWESSGQESYTPSEGRSGYGYGRSGYRYGAKSRAFFSFGFTLSVVAIISGAVLARRNIRSGRGDRRGATRLALYILALQLLIWLFQAHHVSMPAELNLLYSAVAWAVFYAAAFWVLYVALEPSVRRRWPYRIISWSRLLLGRLRDDLVGRDILIGAALGTAFTSLVSCLNLSAKLIGIVPDRPPSVALDTFLGVPKIIGQFLSMQRECVTDPLYVIFIILLLSNLFRRDWRAFVVAWVLITFGAAMLFGVRTPANWILAGIMVAGYLTVLARFGLLATIIFQFYNFMLSNFPLTSDFSSWYAGATVFALLITVSLACCGFFSALSGRAAFRRSLFHE